MGHVLLSAPITIARAVEHPGDTCAECQPYRWRCEGAVAEGESRLGCTHHGFPSLAWLPLSSPLPAESSLRLTTAWWALQTSTYHLSTYGSFWICHLDFSGAALSCPPYGFCFCFFSFGQDSYKKTVQNTQMPHKTPDCPQKHWGLSQLLTILGSIPSFLHKEIRGTRTPRPWLLFLVFLCRGETSESFHTQESREPPLSLKTLRLKESCHVSKSSYKNILHLSMISLVKNLLSDTTYKMSHKSLILHENQLLFILRVSQEQKFIWRTPLKQVTLKQGLNTQQMNLNAKLVRGTMGKELGTPTHSSKSH